MQWPEYQIASHHKKIADALEAVERGEIKRLIIEMPPRHGKTMLASQYFPAWYLGRNPENQIIAATYNQDLANDFGRAVRNQLIDEQFRYIFGASAANDSASVSKVSTDKGGVYNAVGVGGALTGRGAHLLLIDDPVKSREAADSELIRRKQQEWYKAVAYTRLMPGGAIIIIQTRWHEDDLAGYVLREHAHEGWVELKLPAIDDTGQALWPSHYPVERLQAIKSTIGIREWSSLYQQEPAPPEGVQFKGEWFRRFRLGTEPKNLRYYISSDYAVTPGQGDYTEHAVWGVDDTGGLWAVDWWYGQTTPDEWIERGLDFVRRYKPAAWIGEAGVIMRSVEPFLRKRMIERKDYCRLEWVSSTTDKPTRARAFEARAASGVVNIATGEWGDRLLDQLIRFPTGRYDDAVDACSLIGLTLDKQHSPMQQVERVREVINIKMPTIDDVFKELMNRNNEDE